MKKISVIIPIHNADKFLKECITSVINQTMSINDIEIILVDDCSTDQSYEIAKEYQREYPNNFIVKRLDKNSGSGGKPRNIGISLASGKYLMFADADDFFADNTFEIMYNAIENKNADFITSNWCYTNNKGIPWKKPVFGIDVYEEFKLSPTDYNKSVYVMNSSMCNKIFNREFINQNNIRCLEDIPGEDTYFSMNAFLNAKNVYYINDITYFYRQRNTGKKSASVSWDCSSKFFIDMSIAYKELYELFSKYEQINFYRFIYIKNMMYLLYRFIDSTSMTNQEKINLLPKLRNFFGLTETLKIPVCQKSAKMIISKIINEKYDDVIDICEVIAEIRRDLTDELNNKMAKPYQKMYAELLNEQM